MQTDCILKTDGYNAIFHLLGPTEYPGYVRLGIDLVIHPSLASLSLSSVASTIAIADLSRLADYFEEHIHKLVQDPNHDSDVFVEWELGFQARAFVGDVMISEDGTLDGGFTLYFAVNLGKADEDSTNTFVGAESLIEVPNVMAFVTGLREYVGSIGDQGGE
jgi:hypothetical protein